MEMEKYIVAIEIGSSKVTGAIATRSPKGNILILGVDTLPINGSVKRGIVVNPEEVSFKIKKLLMLLGNRLGGSKEIVRAYVGITGQSLHAEDYTVSRDYPENTCIGEELIRRLENEVKEMPIAETDVLEVVRTDVLVDNNLRIGNDEIEGSNLKIGLKLITARKALKVGAIRAIPSTLDVVKYIPLNLTTSYVALTNEDRQAGVMLVDFGAETTTISIYKKGMLHYLSTIPLGGANITRDIMSLKVTGEEAESFKVRLGSAKITGDEADITLRGENASEIKSSDLAKVVKARIEEIVANVKAHFEYAKCDPNSLEAGMVIIGGTSKLSNLTELLAEKCNIRVRKGALRQDVVLDRNTQTNSSDYLQILGLIFCGDENCVALKSATVVEQKTEPQPEVKPATIPEIEPKPEPKPTKPEPEPKKEKKESGLKKKFSAFKERFLDFINEDDDSDKGDSWDSEQDNK